MKSSAILSIGHKI